MTNDKTNEVMTPEQYKIVADKVAARMQQKKQGMIVESQSPIVRDQTAMVGYTDVDTFIDHMVNGIRA